MAEEAEHVENKPDKPDEMKLTASEIDRIKEILTDSDNIAREMAGIELRKVELLGRLSNLMLEQRRVQEKIAKRLGIQDGQFTIDVDKGIVVPQGGMMRRMGNG